MFQKQFLKCFKSSFKEKCHDVTMLKFETSHYYVEQDKTKRTYLHVMTIVFSPSHAGFSAITLACVVTSCGESCGNNWVVCAPILEVPFPILLIRWENIFLLLMHKSHILFLLNRLIILRQNF